MSETAINTELNIYPIGRFTEPTLVTADMREEYMQRLTSFPSRLKKIVDQLSEEQLLQSYRDGGWNARQIIHHIADSHMNAYIRFKLAMTEDQPTIKPYLENNWSALEEVSITPVAVSVELLHLLHQRWVNFLRSLSMSDFQRAYIHPQYNKTTSLNHALALYAWHADHHLGQVEYILNN